MVGLEIRREPQLIELVRDLVMDCGVGAEDDFCSGFGGLLKALLHQSLALDVAALRLSCASESLRPIEPFLKSLLARLGKEKLPREVCFVEVLGASIFRSRMANVSKLLKAVSFQVFLSSDM